MADPHKVMISDSLLRKLPEDAIKDCRIIPRPGKNFETLRQELLNGQIKIVDYDVIGLLIGTNDISDWVVGEYGLVGYRQGLKWCHVPRKIVSWDSVWQNFLNLMITVQDLNPAACLVVSGIIPRLGDWQWSREACRPIGLTENMYTEMVV